MIKAADGRLFLGVSIPPSQKRSAIDGMWINLLL
jgi:hypothetical protein